MQYSKRDTDVKNRFLDSVGEDEGVMIWENSIETCILPHVKWMTSQVWSIKQDTQRRCTGTTQRDGMGWEMGRGFTTGEHMYTWGLFMSIWQKPPQYCKVISFQLKWRGRREEGSGWGTHVHPWLIHDNVWQKPLQYYKVISLQLKQIN